MLRRSDITSGLGCDKRPWTFALHPQSDVEELLFAVMLADDLQPDWASVNASCWYRDRRISCDVGGEREATVVSCAGDEPAEGVR